MLLYVPSVISIEYRLIFSFYLKLVSNNGQEDVYLHFVLLSFSSVVGHYVHVTIDQPTNIYPCLMLCGYLWSHSQLLDTEIFIHRLIADEVRESSSLDLIHSPFCLSVLVIAALTGLVGILTSALLIAVLAQKLLLTRSQKYVHNFVLNTELARRRHEHAANVVKFAVKVWYLRRHGKIEEIGHLIAQRKLFCSISYLQQTKQQQKTLLDNCVGLHELMTLQQNINTQYVQSASKMTEMDGTLTKINDRLDNLTENIETFQHSFNRLINLLKKPTEAKKLSFF